MESAVDQSDVEVCQFLEVDALSCAQEVLPIPICFAFCCAASEATTAASKLSIGTERVPAISSVMYVKAVEQCQTDIRQRRGTARAYIVSATCTMLVCSAKAERLVKEEHRRRR